MNETSSLGPVLRRRRAVLGLTRKELAGTAGVSLCHIGRIEQGKRYPSAKVLRKLSQPLGLSEKELFILAGYMVSEAKDAEVSRFKLDPIVELGLSQEPVEVQRALVGLLMLLKALLLSKSNTNNSAGGQNA